MSAKKSHKTRKWGRNSRKPGSACQEARTLANKRRRVMREARKSTSYTAIGWTIRYVSGGVSVEKAYVG